MGVVEDSVRPLLYPTESVDVAVKTVQLPQVGIDLSAVSEDGEGTTASADAAIEEKDEVPCVLAVVFHVGADEAQEGSMFICKRKAQDAESNEELAIYRAIPISKDFSISMAQMRRNTIDLSTDSSRSVLEQPRVGFTIIINSGQDGDEGPLYFYTHDTQALKALIAECKRFKDQTPETTPGTYETSPAFAWLLPYEARARSSPSTTARPWDLRVLNEPLYSRLSPAIAGIPEDEIFDVITIRDKWIRDKLRATERRGTDTLKIRLGTFNVNGTIPSQDLSSWVQGKDISTAAYQDAYTPLSSIGSKSGDADTKSVASGVTLVNASGNSTNQSDTDKDTAPESGDNDPDIFIFGFQELDLSTEALLYHSSTFREDTWTTAIFAALGEKAAKYEKLSSKQLVGILVTIIVRRSIKQNFKDVKTVSAGVGVLGLLGNKGGTAIRLEYAPSSQDSKSPLSTAFTFVNAHLAAFDEMYERRNADYQDLCRRLTFPSDITQHVSDYSSEKYSIFDTDVLFWIVHLNYRIDLSDQDIRDMLQSDHEDKFEALLTYDQLYKAKRTKKAFVGFSESRITHLPTYRFAPGLTADGLGYDLKRKPAWTDRVQYMHDPSIRLEQQSYTGHSRITQSDHRPVGAEFTIQINLYDSNQIDAAARKLYRQLEPLEHASFKPSLKLDTTTVDLGEFSYRRPVTKTLELRNTGKTPCAYRLLQVDKNTPISPEWLKIEPMAALLLPEEIVTLTLTAAVDSELSSKLNFGQRNLECTLILHTMLGKDLIIDVKGHYGYTCFGMELTDLTRINGPVRALESVDAMAPVDQARNAPKEILRMVNYLMNPDVELGVLFVKPVQDEIVNTICQCLDTGDEFKFPKIYAPTDIAVAFGATLMELFNALPEPLVPTALHLRCTQMTNRDEAFELLDAFPQTNVNVWISTTAFLHFVCQSSSDQDDRVNTMLSIWTPILLRDDLDGTSVSPYGKRRFLRYFIT